MKQQVLIYDENWSYYIETLEKMSFEVTLIEKGVECEEFIRISKSRKYDLFIINIRGSIENLNTYFAYLNPSSLIFTSSSIEDAILSYDFGAIDFVLFPFTMGRFVKGVRKVQNNADRIRIKHSNVVYFKTENGIQRFLKSQILYVRAQGDHVKLNTKCGSYTVRSSMYEIHKRLGKQFFRNHRSYLLNLNEVSGLNKKGVVVKDKVFPITNINRRKLKSIMISN